MTTMTTAMIQTKFELTTAATTSTTTKAMNIAQVTKTTETETM